MADLSLRKKSKISLHASVEDVAIRTPLRFYTSSSNEKFVQVEIDVLFYVTLMLVYLVSLWYTTRYYGSVCFINLFTSNGIRISLIWCIVMVITLLCLEYLALRLLRVSFWLFVFAVVC
ncbi:hypothetical protein AHAS_Ahas07G0121200 [Arachis hypogaea]